MTIILDEKNLSVEQVVAIAKGVEKVEVSEQVRSKLSETRKFIVENWMTDEAPLIYTFNTGLGAFKDRRILIKDIKQYQKNMIQSHATGIGEPLSIEASRAVMLLRLNAFKSDYSGVSLSVIDRLVAFLNLGLTPIIPIKGSVGASGDLAPLAHMSGALCGYDEAEIIFKGQRMPAAEALLKAGLPRTLELHAKDASALINGSTVSLALAVLALSEAEEITKNGDIGLALSLEAMRCEKDAFHPALHAARPHPGQQLVARNIMRMIGVSKRMSSEARKIRFPDELFEKTTKSPPRVQDVYSLRCAPQVHGPVREALAYIRSIVEREISSATDNPLIILDNGQRRAVSGGHFHGQYIAQAMDLLSITLTDLGSICERRIARLIDPTMSYGLPRNLTGGQQGLNTGYATVHCSMSALVMENRTLSNPGSTDSIPAKGNAEDHVSNSMWCAQKATVIVKNVQSIVSSEILVAAQALSLIEAIAKEHELAPATRSVLKEIRTKIPARLEGDVWFGKDIAAITEMVKDGRISNACEAIIGDLE